jgi:hypothetical protein
LSRQIAAASNEMDLDRLGECQRHPGECRFPAGRRV